MSTQKIPNEEKLFIQSNVGDYQGNVWSTFNIDFDSSPGVIKPSKRLDKVLGENEIGDDFVQALTTHDGKYYVITDNQVFECSTGDDPTNAANWSEETTLDGEDQGFETDATSFNGLLLISLGTDIMSWNGSSKDDDWWTNTVSGSALTSGKTHTLEVLRTGNDTLFVTDGNVVRYYNSSAGHTAITLESLFTAHVLLPALDKMWVGTYTEVENNAYVYEVQVGDDIADNAYPVDGRAVFSGFTYRNTPFVITERGYIQGFNGAGFETVAQFPWANDSATMNGVRPGLIQDTAISRAIHPKGVKVSGKFVFIYVDAEDEYGSNGDLLSNRGYSGVWVLDLDTYSLTHRYSLTAESTDYGTSKVSRSGPLMLTNTPETRIMVGGEVNGDAIGVWMEGTATQQGFFTTVRHEADSVADAFEKAVIKADTLDTGESIEVKYKSKEEPQFPYKINDIVWLDSTRFNTSDALTGITADDDGKYGHEIFILAGHQAGKMCHILDISGSTTKTVTVDESLGTLNEESDIIIERWEKVGNDADDDDGLHESDDGEYSVIGANEVSTFRQYKVVMTGDVTFREIISKSNNKNEL